MMWAVYWRASTTHTSGPGLGCLPILVPTRFPVYSLWGLCHCGAACQHVRCLSGSRALCKVDPGLGGPEQDASAPL
ncbi:hypothetical protein ACCO45_011798 [Purpureocillium lilacinum]|uniref:Uncharacterized protein n=1 Tax=Purpureocillium lilacinum TaxID=33203 RepID=A0ACC4DBV4_PURLI